MDEPGTGQDEVAPRQTYPRKQLDHKPGQRPPRQQSPGTGADQDGEPPDTEDDEIVPL